MSTFNKEYKRLLSFSNIVSVQYPRPETFCADSLKRVKRFLKELGNPEEDYEIVHVTGTSGKGSTVQLMKHILTQSGFKAGAYVSPHISSYSDRFLLNDGTHKESVLTKALKTINDSHEEFCLTNEPLTFFELSTALAFLVNSMERVDYLVLEVGLGGTWDATNVIKTPKLAIITNIDKDHTDILGDTLAAIAGEKAGIIKKKGTVLVGESRTSLKPIFKEKAIECNATLFFVPPVSVSGENGKSAGQLHNVAIVKRAAEELGIDEIVVEKALQASPVLPARFERMPDKQEIYVDGAHSPAKMASTASQITQLGAKRVHILFGASQNKDLKDMTKALAKVSQRISTTRFTGTHRQAANPVKLAKFVPSKNLGKIYMNPQIALKEELANAKKAGAVLVITGSYFLAGELREHWYPSHAILEQATLFPSN